ncbi:glycosyltransferase [Pseudobutyrivibrio ruminis]|uniref:glycosyltransferase n=1 Tax=Pseudobutyrivibrio ruminis TaxID=46206 RepID=UPI000484B160|nr:glycosyltransferase [Pseudobutyrivibrio ruminis]
MKEVFIIITDMGSGGAQKSLLSFFQALERTGKTNDYNIDLVVVNPKGIFMNQIPDYVNVIQAQKTLAWMGVESGDEYLKNNFSLLGLYGKIKFGINKKFNPWYTKLNSEQKLWASWNTLIPNVKKKYDIAISYLNGYPNYYVIDKVQANKKVLWIHNEYQKLKYNINYDEIYYNKCDEIITISKECLDSFTEIFPQHKNKISVLENISLSSDIIDKSKSFVPEEFENYAGLKLLSIGRLNEQKGFDFAIEAAKILLDKGMDFKWLILGEGPDRKKLESLINEKGIEKCFLLLGIKDNPYPYIRYTDIFLQTSRFEGKSIVLDEAKILLKPIVVTNYPTVYDSIENGITGTIVNMDGNEIAEAVIDIENNSEKAEQYIENLKKMNSGNESEIQKYMSIML